VHNSILHGALHAFTTDAAAALAAETAAGAEVPFEVDQTRAGGRAALYCYRPLTDRFIDQWLPRLTALSSYGAAARAVRAPEGIDTYLDQRGATPAPADPQRLAEAVLQAFLARVFAERSDFTFDLARFQRAYEELERALYEGRSVATVVAPVLGIGLDPAIGELEFGEGLSLLPGELLGDAPAEAIWGTSSLDGSREPNVLAVLRVDRHRDARGPVSLARGRFRRVLTALRLWQRGGYALGPLAWVRADTGVWRPVAFGGSGRPGLLTLVSAAQTDELRAFWNLVARRVPTRGELAWALARFEMGCERLAPFEALTDHLLALRALLEPEGPHSGRLAGRLAVLCAPTERRAGLAERTAHVISLERAVIAGLAPAQTGVDSLVAEIAEHLRALLRDVVCGHLDPDLCAVADGILAEAVTVAA